MNLLHLYYFCKLVELQHYIRAAAELYISQPSLSGAIASLESELGISLFQKRGRNIYLTKYGKEFYGYVHEALQTLDTGIAIAKEHAGELSGTIEIGSISTIQSDYLPLVISAFREIYPQIHFRVYEGQTNSVCQGVLNDTYDVGFCTYMEDQNDLFFVPIMAQPIVAVVKQGHPLAELGSVTLSQLADYDLVTYTRSQPVGGKIGELLEKNGLNANYNYCSEILMGGMISRGTSADGPMVALMMEVPALREFPDTVVLPISDIPKDFHVVHMIFHNKSFKSHAVGRFIDFVSAFYSYRPDQQDSEASGSPFPPEGVVPDFPPPDLLEPSDGTP